MGVDAGTGGGAVGWGGGGGPRGRVGGVEGVENWTKREEIMIRLYKWMLFFS